MEMISKMWPAVLQRTLVAYRKEGTNQNEPRISLFDKRGPNIVTLLTSAPLFLCRCPKFKTW